MPGWDYSGNGMYFITLVTQNRECNLGQVVVTQGRVSMQYSDFGKIVRDEWIKSFEIRNELFLDEYIIMPNHLHAIIILNNPNDKRLLDSRGIQRGINRGIQRGINRGIHRGIHREINHENGHGFIPSGFIRKPRSISSFIAGFKSAINSKIDDFIDEHNLDIPKYNRNNHFFQPNYHDHIIRDEGEYLRISEYIINNPAKWHKDHFYRK